MSRARVLATIAIVALVTASCSKSPEQAFENGNRYFKNKQYKDAIIEYRYAIQKNPRFGEARLKLAETYVAVNDAGNAFQEYVRAADLLPGSVDAQVKAATFLLLAGQFEDAKDRATKALKLDPRNIDAHIVFGNAAAGLKDLDEAISQIQDAIQMDPGQGRTYINLGALEAARGNREKAEAALRKAIELDPKSVDAHLSLAYFYWAGGQVADAEQALKAAVAADPGSVLANRFAAAFYMSSNRATEAEPYLKVIAQTTKEPAAAITLADYYTWTNRGDDAIRTLESVAGQKGWYGAARPRIAGIRYVQGNKAEAHKIIDEVLTREPKNAPALLVKARFLMAENKLDEALARSRAAADADRKSTAARYLLGILYTAKNDPEEAIRAFNEVLQINPRAAAAQMQLSQLQLASGAVQPAVQFAEQAVQNDPSNAAAHLTLARSLIASGQLPRAEAELKQLGNAYPQSAAVHAAMGSLLMLRNEQQASRRSFERALQLDANSYEAVAGLVQLDVNAKKLPDARARIERQLARLPNNGPLLVLAGRLYAAGGDNPKAEQALQKAIQVAPSTLQAYGILAQLYLSERKLDEAKARLEDLARRQRRPVGAETMIGMILQLQNKSAEAQKQYEKVLEIDPRAPVAANNLAWLYAEGGGNLDIALQLAQTAKAGLADIPEVNDTLGWVYYKKALPGMAVPPLDAAAKAQPDNPTYQYHLGLAYVGAGDKTNGRQALERALKLKPDFDGAAEARKVLASIQ